MLVQHAAPAFVPGASRRNLFGATPFVLQQKKENVMNSIIWLVGAVVIIIAVLNLVGFA
ncbi:hypothetical protein QTA58_15790 [Neorhizobium sp. CSC1952]|uniref:hypothetical protein n=1 Tax=Neorhizobium TaxID=1525371 RepID=UPI0025A53D3E|nr:hypothetical protein [Rhizobium sp. CSC1952]WJR65689.1 hypothetical protein QTA58_15790 [Rhizobium sp. CSC1952]